MILAVSTHDGGELNNGEEKKILIKKKNKIRERDADMCSVITDRFRAGGPRIAKCSC